MQLTQFLDDNRNYLPTYVYNSTHTFSNHASMALIALQKLGADDQQLQRYYDHYCSSHEKVIPSLEKINQQNFVEHFGQPHDFSAFVSFFDEELIRLGWRELLTIYLHPLQTNFASHAFHPLIRLAYAIEAEDYQDLPYGLAYLASYFTPLNIEASTNAKPITFSNLLVAARQNSTLSTINTEQKQVTDRLQFMSQQQKFVIFLQQYKLENLSLANIAEVGLQFYLNNQSIIALHTVTGSHALRILLPFCNNPSLVLHSVAQAITALYILFDCPELQKTGLPKQLPDWQKIIMTAINSNDAHDIKLTYTCQQEDKTYHNPLYRLAASINLNLV